jgi:hypothetical protein
MYWTFIIDEKGRKFRAISPDEPKQEITFDKRNDTDKVYVTVADRLDINTTYLNLRANSNEMHRTFHRILPPLLRHNVNAQEKIQPLFCKFIEELAPPKEEKVEREEKRYRFR